jgi:RNA polymerase sigma-70 factor (ECF subfamily)
MLEASSLELIARAQRGDKEALGMLYDQHQSALFRYLYFRSGDRQLAEDLTGDVFIRMLAALPRYRSGQVPFRAWLYRIAHNRLVDYYRRESGRSTVALSQAEAQPDVRNDPCSCLEQKLTTERLSQALLRLDDVQREVVTMRFLSGLSLREVALALEKSEDAVKALQGRGLATLRQALA